MNERVLIAAPTYVGKEYSMKRWLENVKTFDYPEYDIFLVDNSPSDAMFVRWKNNVDMVHFKGDHHLLMRNITRSMEIIRQHFLKGKYAYWFNLEVDVLPHKSCVNELLKLSRLGWDLVSHAYPARKLNGEDHQGVGCCIINRFLANAINYNDAGDVSPDGWLWGKVRKHTAYKMIDCWNLFPIQHLNS